jgi:RNA polymerase sigma factor (sigma-70 family)
MAITEAKLHDEATLVDQACHGDNAAFEELYRRHAQAAWRMAQAVTRNADDAADAVAEAFSRVFAAMLRGSFRTDAPFRPYLLTATRNAAIDTIRHGKRTVPTEDESIDLRDDRTPGERVDLTADTELVSAAFRTLPERWRSVLWLTEVEGLPPRAAADVLGLTPNGTSQLAVRARAGLRERYLQAHLRDTEDNDCKRTVGHLGSYVAGTLAPRDVARVDQHLAGCAECQERVEELLEVGHRLRAIVLPLPLALGFAAKDKWAAMFISASKSGPLGLVLPGGTRVAPWAERALAGAAAAVVTLGIVGATIIGSRGGKDAVLNGDESAQIDGNSPFDLSDLGLDLSSSVAPSLASLKNLPGASTATSGIGETPRGDTQTAPSTPIGPIGGTGTSPEPAAPAPPSGGSQGQSPAPTAQVNVGAKLRDQAVGVSVGVGGGCTGVSAGGTPVGCEAPAPEEEGVAVELAPIIPPVTVTIPL